MKAYSIGSVFWYRMAGKLYGAVVLDHQNDTQEYFIGISEAVIPKGKSPTADEILEAKPYTAAWFDSKSLLSPIRIHVIGKTEVNGSYANRGGRFNSEEKYVNKNTGMRYTWSHVERMLVPKWEFMKTMLDHSAFPETWVS